jgi:broad specificity phosphatase PhoE
MSTVVLIRHGETDWAGKFCGYSDPRLNASGKRDAIRVAEEVSRLDIARIYSSDLRRAAQTARAIAKRTGIAVEFLTGLREIHFGQWEGLSWHEIESRSADEAHLWQREFPFQSAPGGETYSGFTTRVETTIEALLREAPGMTVAVVTHRGVMRHALTKLFGFAETEASSRTAAYGSTVITTRPLSLCEVLP